ncbi:N-acetylmuramoyl-L-alanine amidase [Mycolicibacterium fortuitum]|uniref:N-acetylmuramoyl-L-alanine amidase n=1 Tax=Mycolicibacterium fortuitum TaxID=1766 RepID=UPI00241CDD28|nr:N-acetylmuramoyl-L-alanine amidase [Mycolicibacterium fortuitum]MDG5773968.1 N-acetylmuramoyl-L-alanine amidase [Mycolicibacterium fortuitum]MDG5779646.1 N-acetylmuramoyl-L-alanine amidase [Mycolicibacterium fortuitum]
MTKDQVAQLIVAVAKARGYTRNECLAVKSALYQESGWDESIWDPTHTTYGIAQQDGSYPDRFNGANAQVKAFFDRLDTQRRKPGASADIWLNICWLQQAPNWPSAQYWYDHGRRAYLTEIKSRIATVTPYLNKYWSATGEPVPDNRPDFNEWPMWSPNNSSRGGTKVDLWILHTQEGGGGDSAAEDLAKYLQRNNVSYHYTASQASDGGVTVVDVVDTDYASWSVLSANPRSINFCFAGSRASWTRDQWMKQSKAIDAAAYLAVQDCKKYGIPLVVIGTGGKYSTARAGVTDHQYVTKVLGDGTHTDVGAGFPVDYFTERFNFWAAGGQTTPPPVTEKRFPDDWTDRELLVEVLKQLRGPALAGWPQLGGKSLVDAVSEFRKAAS